MGKQVDFDGYFGFQCLDLMHQYILEVLGVTDRGVLRAPVAKSVFQNFANVHGSNLFTKIDNTPNGIPNKGDLFFWKEPFGRYIDNLGRVQYAGHVGIYISGDLYNFKTFDQNFSANVCRLESHNYNKEPVLGWLRFKGNQINWDDKVNKMKNALNAGGTSEDRAKTADRIFHEN